MSVFKPNNRGAFILFEGVDRCGKTTQANRLVAHLKKERPVEFMRFPERSTTIGKMINSYLTSDSDLDDRTVHLLFSANRWEASAKMHELLNSGTTIVCDRYSYSGVAFSAAKPGMDVNWCYAPEKGLPAPDAIVYLDLPVEKAMQRGQFGEERYEKEEFQKVVRDNFFEMMKQQPELWTKIDADQSIEDVEKEIHTVVEKALEEAAAKPIAYL